VFVSTTREHATKHTSAKVTGTSCCNCSERIRLRGPWEHAIGTHEADESGFEGAEGWYDGRLRLVDNSEQREGSR